MTSAPRQLQVLRLLHAHRLMDTQQVHALGFRGRARRTCRECLTTLYRRGLAVRFEPQHGGLGGGRSGFVYGLSAPGASALNQTAGIPLAEISYEAEGAIAEAHFVNHQLAVNRCCIALWQALDTVERHQLVRWNSDPHLRMRYRVGRGWQVIHPDGLAQIQSPAGEHWLFFEIDRATQELRRYELKVRRYVRFWRSGAWRSEFPVFPELRITTTHRARVARLRRAAEDGVRGVVNLDSRAVSDALQIAVAWEPEFLADPLGPVWEPTFSQGASRHNLLRATAPARAHRKEALPATSL